MKKIEYRIRISPNLPLNRQLSLIRKILKNSQIESIIVSTENARSLGQILSFHKTEAKVEAIIYKK